LKPERVPAFPQTHPPENEKSEAALAFLFFYCYICVAWTASLRQGKLADVDFVAGSIEIHTDELAASDRLPAREFDA
jgi:hypothetical protein